MHGEGGARGAHVRRVGRAREARGAGQWVCCCGHQQPICAPTGSAHLIGPHLECQTAHGTRSWLQVASCSLDPSWLTAYNACQHTAHAPTSTTCPPAPRALPHPQSQFEQRAAAGTLAVVYYTGHGAVYEGVHYMLPIEYAPPEGVVKVRARCGRRASSLYAHTPCSSVRGRALHAPH